MLVAVVAAAASAGDLLRRGDARRRRRARALAAALGLLPAAGRRFADRDLAAYHGVEHKAIGAYEQGRIDPADVAKEHERCGSNLIAPLLVLSAAGQLTVDRLLERPGPGRARLAAAVGASRSRSSCSPGASATPNRRSRRAFRRPGTEIQRLLATREPTAEQLEVGTRRARGDPARRGRRGPRRPGAGGRYFLKRFTRSQPRTRSCRSAVALSRPGPQSRRSLPPAFPRRKSRTQAASKPGHWPSGFPMDEYPLVERSLPVPFEQGRCRERKGWIGA